MLKIQLPKKFVFYRIFPPTDLNGENVQILTHMNISRSRILRIVRKSPNTMKSSSGSDGSIRAPRPPMQLRMDPPGSAWVGRPAIVPTFLSIHTVGGREDSRPPFSGRYIPRGGSMSVDGQSCVRAHHVVAPMGCPTFSTPSKRKYILPAERRDATLPHRRLPRRGLHPGRLHALVGRSPPPHPRGVRPLSTPPALREVSPPRILINHKILSRMKGNL